jgi:hypothetical protein
MRLTLLTLLLLTSVSLDACFAMLTDEYTGPNVTQKVCVYNHLGDTVTTVIKSTGVCPSMLSVDH